MLGLGLNLTSITAALLDIVRSGLKMWLPFEKSEILGEDLTEGYDFQSGWSLLDATPDNANTFTSDPDGGVYKTLVDAGKSYKLTIAGTTTASSGIRVGNVNDSIEYYSTSSSGAFSDTAIFVATQTNVYIKNKAAGEATITTFKIQEVTQIAPDKSSNSNGATLYTGKALSFDGVNDYVDFGSDVNNNRTVWTTAIWISNYTRGSYDWIYGDTTQESIGLNYDTGVDGNIFYRQLNDTFVQFSCDVFKSDFTNAKRLVFTSDGTDISLYIDGEFIDSITPTSTNLKISRLMAGYNTTDFMVDATVSDFQLYNVAWTQADVTFDYNNPQHLVTDNPSIVKTYGSEIVTDGGFDDPTEWNANTGWTVSGGKASVNTSSTTDIRQTLSVTKGKIYDLTFELSDYVEGSFQIGFNQFNIAETSDNLPNFDENGVYNYRVVALSDNINIYMYAINASEFSIDNLSLKEETSLNISNIKGYWHLSEGAGGIVYDSSGENNDGTINGATASLRQDTIPQLGLMDWSKGSNLITYSEDFSNAGWGNGSNATVTSGFTSPTGLSTAYRMNASADEGDIRFTSPTIDPSNLVSVSIFAKKGTTTKLKIVEQSYFGTQTTFDLDSGSIDAGGNTTSSKIENYGNGWYRCSITQAYSSGQTSAVWGFMAPTAGNLFLWGAQIEEASSPSAYRKTNGSTVIDATLISDPNDPSKDVLDNTVRLREHSLNLDAIGYAQVDDDNSLDFGTGDFSLEVWVKADYLNQGNAYNTILSLGDSVINLDNAAIVSLSNTFRFLCGGNTSAKWIETTNYTQNSWTHLVAVRDSGTTKFYMNTTSQSGGESNNSNITNNDAVLIGKDSTTNRFYSNLIDDVRIYNRALSLDEVKQNYNAGLNQHKTGSSFSDDFSSDYGL